MGHRSISARGSVLLSGLALLRCGLLLLLLLQEKIMLPVKLLPLRIHDVENRAPGGRMGSCGVL